MKNSLTVFITSIFFSVCVAQETSITPIELAELRKTPDTSNAVIMEQGTGEQKKSQKELEGVADEGASIAIEDLDNPGTFIAEGFLVTPKVKQTQPQRSGVRGTSYNLKNSTKTNNTKYSASSLDTHALALAANCNPVSSRGTQGAVTINLGDSFFVIPIKSGELPPLPVGGGKQGIHGIDVNQNCVRDDVEHYIFNKYPRKSQEKLRLNLYAHAIWLNFFLIKPISDRTIQGITRQTIKTGGCMNIILGNGEGRLARGDLFAHVHNTMERSERYFENYEVLRGFMIEENITGACL